MRALVCVKAVSSKLVYSNEQRADKLTLNPYDLCALENLLEKKKNIDLSITCLCMGPQEAKQVLIHCLAMGADEAILISDRCFAGSDTYATSYILHKAIQKLEYDVIVCGGQAVDGETGQVTYGLAERLGLPCITDVLEVAEIDDTSMNLHVKGIKCIKILKVQLPVVIAFHNFQTESGKINLMALKKAQRKPIQVWTAKELNIELNMCGQAGSKTQVLSSSSVLDKKNICFLNGSSEDRIQFLMDKLRLYSHDITA